MSEIVIPPPLKRYKAQWQFRGKGENANRIYTVSECHSGKLICDCRGFRLHPDADCWHMKWRKQGMGKEVPDYLIGSMYFGWEYDSLIPEVDIWKMYPDEIILGVPYIPQDDRSTHMDATIVYDFLFRFQSGTRVVKVLARQVIFENPIEDIVRFVQENGRMVWAVDEEGRRTNKEIIIPVVQEVS